MTFSSPTITLNELKTNRIIFNRNYDLNFDFVNELWLPLAITLQLLDSIGFIELHPFDLSIKLID